MDSISRREANVKGKDGKILFQEEGVEPTGYINHLLGRVQSRIGKNEEAQPQNFAE